MLLLTLLLACGSPPPLQCTAALEPLEPTIPHVTWTATEAAQVYVTYGVGEMERTTTPMDVAPGPVDILLPGYGPGQDIQFEAVAETDQGTSTCAGTIRTRTPECAPALSVVVDQGEASPPFQYLMGATWQMGGGGTLFIVDRTGAPVWCVSYDATYNPFDATWAWEGTDLWASRFHQDHNVDDGTAVRFALDGNLAEERDLPMGHHFFTELPPDAPDGAGGTLAFLALDVRPWTDPESGETMDVVGDAVMEVTPDGDVRTVLSTWDVLDVTESFLWNAGFYSQGRDWTHGNSIHYNLATDTYLLSLGGLDTLLEMERATGQITRSFGTSGALTGMYGLAEGATPFHLQHDAFLDEAGDLHFFAASMSENGGLSFTVDDQASLLRQSAAVGFDLGYESFALGQYLPLETGGALLNFATSGVVVEVDAAGAVAWQLETELGHVLGNVHPFTDFPNVEAP